MLPNSERPCSILSMRPASSNVVTPLPHSAPEPRCLFWRPYPETVQLDSFFVASDAKRFLESYANPLLGNHSWPLQIRAGKPARTPEGPRLRCFAPEPWPPLILQSGPAGRACRQGLMPKFV